MARPPAREDRLGALSQSLESAAFGEFCCAGVVRLDGESAEVFKARKAQLEATAGRIRAERLAVVVVERDVKPE
jgi:hypothetical protein